MGKRYKSILQTEFEQDYCYRCGRYAPTDWHHIFNSYNKNHSEEYGAMVRVCRNCHEAIHRKEMQEYKRKGQIEVMYHFDLSEDEFREIFGKSYL